MMGTAGRLVGHFSYTMATIQASFANAVEFFNSPLSCLLSRVPLPAQRPDAVEGVHGRSRAKDDG